MPLPLYGKASDIWGRKPILFVALGLFELGSALCAASQNMNMLIASRVIQGVGGGGIMGLVNIIMADITSLRYSALAQPENIEANNPEIAQSGLLGLVRRGPLPRLQVPLLAAQSPVQRLGDGVFSSISPLARCVGQSYLSICILIHRNCPSGIKRREWITWGRY